MVEIVSKIRDRFSAVITETHDYRGDLTAFILREGIIEVLKFCRDDPELHFDYLVDLTVVDYSKYPGREEAPRFEVVYHLLSLERLHRLRLKVKVSEADCWMPTACELYAGANWLEREAWDMFGMEFRGHPNLKRLLMYDEFIGHPLRKDYPFNKEQPLIEPRAGYDSMTGQDRGVSIRPRGLEVHGRNPHE